MIFDPNYILIPLSVISLYASSVGETPSYLKNKLLDPGFAKDIKAWSSKTGNPLIESKFEDKKFKAFIEKGGEVPSPAVSAAGKDGTTMVVFSGEPLLLLSSPTVLQQ